MDIDYNQLMAIKREIRRINAQEFNTIRWFKDGKQIILPENTEETFMQYGLNNTNFLDLYSHLFV